MKHGFTPWSDAVLMPRPLVAALNVSASGLVIAVVGSKVGVATAAALVLAEAVYVGWSQHYRGVRDTRSAHDAKRSQDSRECGAMREPRATSTAEIAAVEPCEGDWNLELPLLIARKQIETSLAYERLLMSSLLDTLPEQVQFKDRDGRFMRVSPSLAKKHGFTNPDEAVGRSESDYLSWKEAQSAAAMERQIISSGEPVIEMQVQEIWPNRPPTWKLVTKKPLRDPQGYIFGTLGIDQDITDGTAMKAQLKLTSERFAIASESAGIGVWELDVESKKFVWDDSMCRMYGISPAAGSLSLAEWVSRLHMDDKARCEHAMLTALLGSCDLDIEFRILRPDGETRFLKAAARIMRNVDGAPERMMGINFDITERKRAELALLETSSLLRTVLDSAAEVSIIATDPTLTIKVFNAGAERILGYTSKELVGSVTPLLIYDPEEIKATARDLSQLTGRRVDGWAVFVEPTMLNKPHQWTYVCKDGRRITVSQVVTAMYTENGGLLGYLSVAHDVTQQKQYEDSLRDATHKAEQASRAKSEFLANMSHEIRTPMNAVIGLSYLLGQTALDSQQSAVLGNINHASKTLLSVINDVLDLSKIEAGELIIEREVFSPLDLVQQLIDVTTIQANAKGVNFTVDLSPDIPPMVEGDAKHLNQILSNLLSNAVRFTNRGQVALRVALLGLSADNVTLAFSVQDTGIGISAEAQSRLFAPFAQADATITRRYGGTGLGLSIVKSLVGLLGGTVQLNSTPGVGSEFTVTLQFALASPEARAVLEAKIPEPGEQPLAEVRILVADDSDINLDVTRRILELSGAKVSLASNGLEAFELLRARPDAYDIVLMDVQMPVLDGYAATRKIRDELALGDLPIIALTAGALSSERQRAVASGMNDFIIKPFDTNTLVSSVLRHFTRKRQTEITDSAAVSPGHAGDRRWPALHGIDIEDARSRLAGDFSLFLSGIRRLLSEYGDLEAAFVPEDPQFVAAFAQRMHKLKGTAGMLGAKVIEQFARRAEAACRGAKVEEASSLVKQLVIEIQRLRQSAAGELAAKPPKDEPLDDDGLAKLADLLRAQDLAAVDRFNSLEGALRQRLGRQAFEAVRDLIDQLRLIEAAEVLRECRS